MLVADENVIADPGVAADLGRWAAGVTWDGVPPDVKVCVRRALLDTVGCMLRGARHPETIALSGVLIKRNPDGRIASAVGSAAALIPADAILLNALATGVDVFDGGNPLSRGHVSGYVLPAVLTAAEVSGATLHETLAAFVAGYEVGARIAAASSMRDEIFTSGTWGVVGAAAAVGHLRKMNATQLADVIGLAADLTLASSRQAVTAGASVRSLYSAMPSYLGFLIADLAAGGFRGAVRAVETVFGTVSSVKFDAGRCVAGLGQGWLIKEDYAKPYPGCRTFHSTIDAILALYPRLARPFDAQRDTLKVGVDRIAYRDNRAVHSATMLAAKESAPVCIAMALLRGDLTPGMFLDGLHNSADVLALARGVMFEEAPRVSELDRPGWAEIALDGQGVLKHAVRIPLGNAGNPLPLPALRRKFVENAAETLGALAGAVADELIQEGGNPPFRCCFSRWLGRGDVQREKLQ